MEPIGLVGLGLLGTAVADLLVRAGYRVIGYDVRPERAATLTALGGDAVASLTTVARESSVVLTLLPSPEAVEAVVCGPDGLVASAHAGTCIVQMSTVSPALVQRLAERAGEAGVPLLDAPVSGTSAMVARREGVIAVAGDRAAFDRCRPLLETLARRVYYVGDCGRASQLKLVTNLVMGLNTVALAEGLTLARKGGLDLAETLEFLRESAAGSRMLEIRGPLMVAGRFDPMMKAELFLKDLALILEEASSRAAPVPLAALMQQLVAAAAAQGWGGQDLAAVMAVYERLATGR